MVDGQGPFTYVWSNGASGPSVSGLAVGTYFLDVIDVNGCVTICEVTIEQIACEVDLELTKNVDNPTPLVGESVVFTIDVINQGPDAATNISVVDNIPTGYSNISNISNGGLEAGSTITWSGFDLANGESTSFTFEATVEAAGDYVNVAEVTAADQADVDSTPNNDDGDQSEDDEDNATVAPIALASLGNYVFEDMNYNGLQDASETGVEGVDVKLLDASGTEIAMTTTDANGFYSFVDLAPGTYSIQVMPPFLYDFTLQDSGDDTLDSDVDPNTMISNPVTLAPGEDYVDLDAGIYQGVTLGNQTWIDVVGGAENLYDAGDAPLPGVIVNLYFASDNSLAGTEVTDALGNYLFTNLPPATYYVEFILPPGYEFIVQDFGSVDMEDSDADVTTGITDPFTLNSGEVNLTIDAGANSPIDLELVKTVSNTTPIVGTDITFSIEISNSGIFDATGVNVEDYLPSGFINPTNISNNGDINGSSIEWINLTIPAGSSLTLTFDATVAFDGIYFNVAEITEANQRDVDSEPGNDDGDQSEDDEDNVLVEPLSETDIELTKVVNDATPNVGDVVTFTITVTNQGLVDATGVEVTDYVPTGFSNLTNISNGGSQVGSDIVWDNLSVNIGEVIQLTFDAEVLSSGNFINTAEVTDNDFPDTDSTPNNDDGDQSEDDEDNAFVNPCDLLLTGTVTDVLCLGDLGGAIDITVSNAVAPITYNWSTGDNTEDISGIGAGTYTVDIVDANGCVANESFTIAEPATSLTCTATGVDATCGDANGTATVEVAGGVGTYTFAWSNGATTQDATGLAAGDYDVTVTDANGCQTICSVSIASSDNPTSSVTSTDSTCGDANGTATVIAQGGTAPYNYAWSNGDNSDTATGLAAGTYTVLVTDALGCETSSTVEILTSTIPTCTIVGTDSTCGDANGSAQVTATGGVGNYTYAWSNGATTDTATGLLAGDYDVTVTDANGCETTCAVTIATSDIPNCSITGVDTSCGTDNGSAQVTATGGVGTYTYQWSTGATTEVVTNLSEGNYDVTVTDSNGCFTTCSVTIGTSTNPTSTIAGTDSTCGDANGSATVTAQDGVAPYVYLWSNGSSTDTANGLSQGTYSVTITDNMGCQTINSIDIATSLNPTCTASATTTTCGDENGTAEVNASGGVGPYTYSWSNGATANSISGLAAGAYTVTVTDSNGCVTSCDVTVGSSDIPTCTTTTTDTTCGDSNGSATVSATGGVAPYTYIWSNGATTATASSLAAGTYTVTVTDLNGCSSECLANIVDSSAPTCSITPTDTACGESNGSAQANATGGTAPYTYAWSNGACLLYTSPSPRDQRGSRMPSSA